jgi:hypothetical protein
MQSLSLGVIAGRVAAPAGRWRFQELLERPEVQHLLWFLLGFVVAAQVVNILANWIASKAVAERQTSTLGCAVKLWFFHLAYTFLLVAAFVLLVPWAFRFEDRWQTWFFLIGLGGLAVVGFFLIPMKVYIISLARAIGLLLLSGVISSGIMAFLRLAALPAVFTEKQTAELRDLGGKNPAERRHFFDRLAGKDAPDEIDRLLDEALQPIGPRRPLAEQEAAAEAIKHKLEERRRTIAPGNNAAVSAFQNQLDRYKQFLDRIRSERSAAAVGGQAH